MGLGHGIYKGAIDNYPANIVVMGEFERGLAEFFRELPGLLPVLILALFYSTRKRWTSMLRRHW